MGVENIEQSSITGPYPSEIKHTARNNKFRGTRNSGGPALCELVGSRASPKAKLLEVHVSVMRIQRPPNNCRPKKSAGNRSHPWLKSRSLDRKMIQGPNPARKNHQERIRPRSLT